jgi:NDP-sugar pyrophosphorylase family protein
MAIGFRAVILAGGRGRRLFPLTAALPKPLVPIGQHTVIELIIRRLAFFGASQITVAVNHLADLIEKYLANVEVAGVAIDCVREATPLGTAGPLGLVERWEGPLVVSNGDILSDIDFRQLLNCHRDNAAALTVATTMRAVRIDAGVFTTDASSRVVSITEKPSIEHRINLGTYVLAERVRKFIPRNQRLEMPDLIMRLVDCGEAVLAYHHCGRWLDIGCPEDLAKAQAETSAWSQMARMSQLDHA